MSLPFWDSAQFQDDWPSYKDPLPPGVSEWEVIYLNGKRAPGIVKIDGGRHLGLDFQRAQGQLLPSIAFLNFDPVPLTLSLTLWTPRQFDELQLFMPEWLPAPGPNPAVRAVATQHPYLHLLGINSLFFQSLSRYQVVQPQVIQFDFQVYEFNPNINVQTKDADSAIPQGTQPGVAPALPPTAPSKNPGSLGP